MCSLWLYHDSNLTGICLVILNIKGICNSFKQHFCACLASALLMMFIRIVQLLSVMLQESSRDQTAVEHNDQGTEGRLERLKEDLESEHQGKCEDLEKKYAYKMEQLRQNFADKHEQVVTN